MHCFKRAAERITEPVLPSSAQDLGEYTAGLLQHVEHDLTAARAAQRHTTAADLGITPLDAMADMESIPARISFINSLSSAVRPVAAVKCDSRLTIRCHARAACAAQHTCHDARAVPGASSAGAGRNCDYGAAGCHGSAARAVAVDGVPPSHWRLALLRALRLHC